MAQSPKSITKNFRNRNIAYGKERRRNMAKIVLENQPHFPKTLNYEDIDLSVVKWLEEEFDLTYNGKKFNTYRLFSNQRMSEYGQTWQNLDEKGNLDINFKTITREPNPQKGDIYGGNYTIPGNITFPIFNVKSLDENGIEYIERYSMKQPFAVNLIYTIGVFTNSYKILNEMNTLVHKQFKSLEKYIFPNGFAIPMELNSVSDESEYTIDDRKYYSQTYQIKVMAFIITKNDYVVTKIPSRVRMPFVGGMNSRRKKEQEETFELDSLSTENIKQKIENCEVVVEIRQNPQTSYKDIMTEPEAKISLEMEELTGKQVCWKDTEDELYVNRKIVYNATVDYCDMKVLHGVIEFKSDYNLMLESIEMRNIATFKFFINDMEMIVDESDIFIAKDEIVKMEVTLKNDKETGYITITTYDTDTVIKKIDEDKETENINI